MNHRLAKLRHLLLLSGSDAVLITHPANVRYLSGYTGDGVFLLAAADAAYAITDFRFLQQASVQCQGYEVTLYQQGPGNREKEICRLLAAIGARCLAFESTYLSFAEYAALQQEVSVALQPLSGLVEQLRDIKDEKEIGLMRAACRSTDEVFSQLLPVIHPGMTEKELEWEIMHRMQLTGNGNYAEFATLAGANGAFPHGKACYEKRIAPGDFITMDFGCICQGYHADMTRTVLVGKPTPKQRQLYQLVLEAQLLSAEAVRPGVSGKEIDRIGRDYITAAGYGEAFGHGMGHGVGLEIHETPYLRATSEDVLCTGQIITVEPGIYLPGWGGIRIEDTILLTDNGHEVLFESAKELICL